MSDIERPLLMCDDSEKDGKAEVVMQYVLSWCFRNAVKEPSNNKPNLFRKCKHMLCELLGFNENDIEFQDVKVWKEECRIDLWVEVKLLNKGNPERHAILIETKYYTGLHDAKDDDGEYRNQLLVYKKKFDKYYEQHLEFKKHYVLISCIYRTDEKFSMYEIAKDFGYRIFSRTDLLDKKDCAQETESDIFNEFWFRDWC